MSSNQNLTPRPTELNFHNGIPLHLQLREIIRYEAIHGELADGNGKMPTEAELIKRFGVSRITVRNALQSLVDEGILVRERGRGTFLKTNQAENWVGRLMGFTEIIKEAGFTPGARILQKGMNSKLPKKVKDNLGIQEGWELKRLRLADDKAIAIETAYYPPEIGLELEKQDLISIAMYRVFEEEMGIVLKDAKQIISAVNASPYESEQLKIGEYNALLYIERVSYSHDQKPVEFLKAVYRPDYFQYIVQLTRKSS